MNDTLKAIFERFSCRAFTDRIPSEEDIELIVKAAVAAPSGMNVQPWKVVVVKNRQLIEDMDKEGMNILSQAQDKSAYDRMMSRGGKLFYNSPLMIMIPTAKGAGVDCGIICENIVIAAASLGMDSLICGLAGMIFSGEKKDEFRKKLCFPETYEFGIAVLLGYAEKKNPPHEPDMSKVIILN